MNVNVELIPSEVLEKVLSGLDTCSQLNAGLVCRRWLQVVGDRFNCVSDLILVFQDGFCEPDCRFESRGPTIFVISFTICQCHYDAHIDRHLGLLKPFLERIGHNIGTFVVEDCLLSSRSSANSRIFDLVFEHCINLSAVQLHELDLSGVHEPTQQRIANVQSVENLVIASPLNSRFLVQNVLRQLSCSRVLRKIQVTNCAEINDRTVRWFARSCPLLWYADFSCCKALTTLAAYQFLQNIECRQSDVLYVKLTQTDVQNWELEKLLFGVSDEKETSGSKTANNHGNCEEVILPGFSEWQISQISQLDIGHSACCIQTKFVPGKCVVLLF